MVIVLDPVKGLAELAHLVAVLLGDLAKSLNGTAEVMVASAAHHLLDVLGGLAGQSGGVKGRAGGDLLAALDVGEDCGAQVAVLADALFLLERDDHVVDLVGGGLVDEFAEIRVFGLGGGCVSLRSLVNHFLLCVETYHELLPSIENSSTIELAIGVLAKQKVKARITGLVGRLGSRLLVVEGGNRHDACGCGS